MKKEDLKNGFMIINSDKAEPLPKDLFDVPSKEREEDIIKLMTEDLRKHIDDKIDVEKGEKELEEKKKIVQDLENKIKERKNEKK